MDVIELTALEVAGARVLVREDLNVPLDGARITDDTRIRAALPTLRWLMERGACTLVASHLGRPREGAPDPACSLAPVAERVGELLGAEVRLASDWLDGVEAAPGTVVLCENVRFNVGEKADDEALARRMAALCDIYVMDAFGTAHRAQASTHGVARFAPTACAGPLLVAELDALGRALDDPARPLVAVVAGSKVSTKLTVLETLAEHVDRLIVGGGIANTFIKAAGLPVGASLHEDALVETAARLRDTMRARGAEIPIPTDVVVADRLAADAVATVKPVSEVTDSEMILDVGPDSAAVLAAAVADAGTVVWNGPVGVFEFDQFSHGTRTLGEAIAASGAFSIAGGGDTLAAIARYGLSERISYISTGGGAFLEFLEGRELPAVAMLRARAAG